MKFWSGSGGFQWEHVRTWNLGLNASEFVRAEGALVLPGGLTTLSAFVRKVTITGGATFELLLWTAPIYFNTLDTNLDANNASNYLLQLSTDPTSALVMSGTTPQVYGAKIKSDQPMGTLLFWQIKNTIAAGALTADIYIVANHAGMLSLPRLVRTVDIGDSNYSAASASMQSGAPPQIRSR